jgi:hypothetical protein
MFILYCKANLEVESGLVCSSIGPGVISYDNRHFTSHPDQKMRFSSSLYFIHLKKGFNRASSDLHLGVVIPLGL